MLVRFKLIGFILWMPLLSNGGLLLATDYDSKPLNIEVIKVKEGYWQPSEQSYAQVYMVKKSLRFSESRNLDKAFIQQGDIVQRGQPLVRFESQPMLNALTNYQLTLNEYAIAKKQLNYLLKSLKNKLIHQPEIFSTENLVSSLNTKVTGAWQRVYQLAREENHLITKIGLAKRLAHESVDDVSQDLSVLLSPFNGVVESNPFIKGYSYHPNEIVLKILNNDATFIDVYVDKKKERSWRKGSVYLAENKNKSSVAKSAVILARISVFDPVSGQYVIRYQIDNGHYFLRDKQWIKVRLLLPPEKVFWVPASAVVSRDKQSWCLIKDKKSYKAIAVSVGKLHDGKYPILNGLVNGQQVVSKGAYELLYDDLKSLVVFED